MSTWAHSKDPPSPPEWYRPISSRGCDAVCALVLVSLHETARTDLRTSSCSYKCRCPWRRRPDRIQRTLRFDDCPGSGRWRRLESRPLGCWGWRRRSKEQVHYHKPKSDRVKPTFLPPAAAKLPYSARLKVLPWSLALHPSSCHRRHNRPSWRRTLSSCRPWPLPRWQAEENMWSWSCRLWCWIPPNFFPIVKGRTAGRTNDR